MVVIRAANTPRTKPRVPQGRAPSSHVRGRQLVERGARPREWGPPRPARAARRDSPRPAPHCLTGDQIIETGRTPAGTSSRAVVERRRVPTTALVQLNDHRARGVATVLSKESLTSLDPEVRRPSRTNAASTKACRQAVALALLDQEMPRGQVGAGPTGPTEIGQRSGPRRRAVAVCARTRRDPRPRGLTPGPAGNPNPRTVTSSVGSLTGRPLDLGPQPAHVNVDDALVPEVARGPRRVRSRVRVG